MKNLYKHSREFFLESCTALTSPYELTQHKSVYIDPDREALTTEYLRIGNPKASKWLILSSGTIGLDYFIGSHVQSYLVRMIGLNIIKIPENTGILMIHGVNPWGAAWLRPGNVNNVILDYNFSKDLPSTISIEEADQEYQKYLSIYKSCETTINTIGWKWPIYHWMKTLYYLIKHRGKFKHALNTHQRFNIIGLNYGGTTIQSEVANLLLQVNKIIPKKIENAVHFDIQTSMAADKNFYLSVEDKNSYDTLKQFAKLSLFKKEIEVPQASLLGALKNHPSNWVGGVLGFSLGGFRSKHIAKRNENIFHCMNIWIENWTRNELSFWPVEKYLDNKYKRRLLKCYYKDNDNWKMLCKDHSFRLVEDTLEFLGKQKKSE